MNCPCQNTAGLGWVPPTPPQALYPSSFAPAPVYLGQTDTTQRNYTPDVVGALAGVAVPWAYVKYRPRKWPKANLWAQLGMVAGTYFGVRYLFTQQALQQA